MTHPGGVATFELGPLAGKWALKIRHPKSLMEKLGVRSDSRVALLGVRDERFRKGQQHIKQSDVMAASKAAGLVDVARRPDQRIGAGRR